MSYEAKADASTVVTINVVLNGKRVQRLVDARLHVSDFLREEFGLFGTRVGCEQGVCGACSVVINGETVRGCLTLAAQLDGTELRTIEGSGDDPVIQALQEAFVRRHAMQCGFCTAGMILTSAELLQTNPEPTRDQIREYLSGNYCRCTGYQAIVDAVMDAATTLSGQRGNS